MENLELLVVGALTFAVSVLQILKSNYTKSATTTELYYKERRKADMDLIEARNVARELKRRVIYYKRVIVKKDKIIADREAFIRQLKTQLNTQHKKEIEDINSNLPPRIKK